MTTNVTLKRDYFLVAMNQKLYSKLEWIVSAFCLIKPNEKSENNKYPFKIIQTPTGFYYLNEQLEQVRIEDAVAGTELFKARENVSIKKGEVENVLEDMDTSYGNILFNYMAVIYPFGNKIPFIDGRVHKGKGGRYLEDMVVAAMQDNPPDKKYNPELIYVRDYAKMKQALKLMRGLGYIFSGAMSEKSMTPPPWLADFKKELIEKYKDRLHDPAAISEITAALTKRFKEWIEGDDAQDFLLSPKSIQITTMKMFLMFGAEAGFNTGMNVDFIANSLYEGLDLEKLPVLLNAQRAGSYNRGAETMLGGIEVKWLFRALSNISVRMEDCGTTLGRTYVVSEKNKKEFLKFSLQTENGPVKIETEDDIGVYMGKQVTLRTPEFCKAGKVDFCAHCVGSILAGNPTALALAASAEGSTFMLIFMKAMHGKILATVKLALDEIFT